jgi:hypothetical protein
MPDLLQYSQVNRHPPDESLRRRCPMDGRRYRCPRAVGRVGTAIQP